MDEFSRIVLCLILDSRQNGRFPRRAAPSIVLCLILDSRQNASRFRCQCGELYCALFWIQGKTVGFRGALRHPLYCALFWIQGKTLPVSVASAANCTVPYFGFKAKHMWDGVNCDPIVLCLILDSRQNCAFKLARRSLIVLCLILDSRQNKDKGQKALAVLYCALFWIQGKTKECFGLSPR